MVLAALGCISSSSYYNHTLNLCKIESEDVHFVARCQSLSRITRRYKDMLRDVLMPDYPKLHGAVNDDDLFTQLMLDCTHPSLDVALPNEVIHSIEQPSRYFTYALHGDRTLSKMCLN